MKRKILIFDIETLPDVSQVFKHLPRIDDWPGQSLKATINSVLCIGYKWEGEKKTHIINAWDYKEWHKNQNDDSQVLRAFEKIIKQADAIVSQNGKKFDIRFLQTRYLINKLDPLPHNIIHLDTKQIAKRYLFAIGNRLNDIAEITHAQKKLEKGGWELWEKVWKKDQKAMALMARYCKQDVKTLEQVYLKLKPFMTQLPNANQWALEKTNCPACGSLKVIKSGYRTYKERKVQRMKCEECGSYHQLELKWPRTT